MSRGDSSGSWSLGMLNLTRHRTDAPGGSRCGCRGILASTMGMVVKAIGKDEIMRYADLYTKVILTVIAGLLAWNTLARFRGPVVHAQGTSSRFFVEEITVDSASQQYQAMFETAINDAAKGRALVTVIPFDQRGKYLAVYTQRP